MRKTKDISKIILFLIIFLLGSLAGSYFFTSSPENKIANVQKQQEQNKNKYVEFSLEVFDKIKKNYWQKISDKDLSNLFKLAVEKITKKKQNLEVNNKEEIKTMLTKILGSMQDESKKKDFTAKLAAIVLYNLQPNGRNQLFTTQKEKELKNMVENRDTKTNLYDVLGVGKDATVEQVKKAYEEKVDEIKGDNSPEAKQKLAKLERAYETLANKENKKRYDQSGVEPTVIAKLLTPNIAYIQIKRMSPATIAEFQKAADSIKDKPGRDALILDLRGNIGGAIDILPYLLGPFIGENQYAYEFFHQDEYTPYKTKTGWLSSLVKYKKVVILIDGETQSSGEVMASVLKKYNVGVLVGTKTKGWGTIETLVKLNNQIDENETYSMLIVHSLTLRDDNQPIEGRGVEPVVDINNPNWDEELYSYFNDLELVKAVKKLYK